MESTLTSITKVRQDIQEGLAFAKAFVITREQRIQVLEGRLAKQQEELELWKAIAEELARQLAFGMHCHKAADSPP